MSNYTVRLKVVKYIDVDIVDAGSEEDAIDQAYEEVEWIEGPIDEIDLIEVEVYEEDE